MVELMSAQIDGELTPAERQQLDSHLRECDDCSLLQQQLRRLESGFARLPEQAPPRLRSRSGRSPWMAYGLAAAAAAVLLSLWRYGPAESSLYFTTGRLHPQAGEVRSASLTAFQSGPLYGKLPEGSQSTRFELHLDSQDQPCSDLRLELAYDFEGDGTVDRHEFYQPFATDGRPGWQVLSDQVGLQEVRGQMRDFQGGKITATLRNAPAHLLILEGKSRLLPPHQWSGEESALSNGPART
jgi:hypothetical protein